MPILIVVSDPGDWPIEIAGARVVQAREYLTKPEYVDLVDAKVFNLCRSYRYQKLGYYVSLVAAARGQRPFPTSATIQDLKSRTIANVVGDEIEEVIQKSLRPIQSERFVLTAYFGRNIAERHSRLALALFRRFPAPLLRAEFLQNSRTKKWSLDGVEALAPSDVPAEHREFLTEVARDYFRRRHHVKIGRNVTAYDLAILVDPDEAQPPSDERAISKFVGAAESLGFDVQIIDKQDFGHLAEFDALFIRETTSVNHRTYRFAQKAAAEGLVVIDDPESILRCTNKVFLAELLHQHDVPTPRTMVVHRGNAAEALVRLGLPCILKQPDSSFSQGVTKAETPDEFHAQLDRLLTRSDLVIAQEYAPTAFDWRIGVFDQKPIYACRYYMASQHWQVIRRDHEAPSGEEGPSEAVALDKLPRKLLRTAVKAANLIGDGLYGVDIKEIVEGHYSVIEVNDNPSIDCGVEDALLQDELYRTVMRVFRQRLEARRRPL